MLPGDVWPVTSFFEEAETFVGKEVRLAVFIQIVQRVACTHALGSDSPREGSSSPTESLGKGQ